MYVVKSHSGRCHCFAWKFSEMGIHWIQRRWKLSYLRCNSEIFHGNHVEKATLIIGNCKNELCVAQIQTKTQLYFNLQIHPHWITRIFYFFYTFIYFCVYVCNTKWSYIHRYGLNNVLFLPFWSIITSLSMPFFVSNVTFFLCTSFKESS